MADRLVGKAALVTGAGGAIGGAIARHFVDLREGGADSGEHFLVCDTERTQEGDEVIDIGGCHEFLRGSF